MILLTDSVVTVKQASELTGMSTQRILRRIRKGQLTAEKIGWEWVIPRTELSKLQ